MTTATRICGRCMQPRENNDCACPNCLTISRRWRYKSKKTSNRKCHQCGEKAEPGSSMCAHHKEALRNSINRKMANRKELCVCIVCSGKLGLTSRIWCPTCYAKVLEANSRSRSRLINNAIQLYGGQCSCGKTTDLKFVKLVDGPIEGLEKNGEYNRAMWVKKNGRNKGFGVRCRGCLEW